MSFLALISLWSCAQPSSTSLLTPDPTEPEVEPQPTWQGCGEEPSSEATQTTASSTVVSHPARDLLYVLNEGVESLSRMDLATGETTTTPLAGWPGRVARVDDQVLVTLRDTGELVVFEETGDALVLVSRTSVGHEPLGVVVHPSGERIHVALAGSGAVVELALGDLSELRRWAIDGQPRWLTGHPDGCDLYVASAFDAVLTHVDLEDGTMQRLDLPEVNRADGLVATLTPRLTGDPAISSTGETLLVPALFVDIETMEGREPTAAYYAPPSEWEEQRLNPFILRGVLQEGEPYGDDLDALFLLSPNEETVAVIRSTDALRSYPTSVAFLPDRRSAITTLEGAETAIAFRHDPDGAEPAGEAVDYRESGALSPPKVVVPTCAGPRGLTADGHGETWVHCLLDQAVAPVGVDAVLDSLDGRATWAVLNRGTSPSGAAISTGAEPLPADLDEGRRLFYTAVDTRISLSGSGASCATCHFDSRNDGLTWPLQRGDRQTPSLAGVVGDTAPVTWSLGVASVADEALETSTVLMGGSGLDDAGLASLAAWIDHTPLPAVAPRGDDETLALGAELFFRPEVGCADCHPAPLFTDNESHTIGGDVFNTPTLLGVGATAPYLHDGSSPTLDDLLARATALGMGDSSTLDDQELAALAAYVGSL